MKKKTPEKKYDNRDPPRILGRVDEKTWKLLKKAAEKDGKSFTTWALEILSKAAEDRLR